MKLATDPLTMTSEPDPVILESQSSSPSWVATPQHDELTVFHFARKRTFSTYPDVIDGEYLNLAKYRHTRQPDGTLTLKTSCYSPEQALQDLRVADSHIRMKSQPLIPRSILKPHIRLLGGLTCFELAASYEVDEGAGEVGIDILHSADGFSRTTIIFRPDETQIVIDRHAANRKKGIDAHVETSPLTLLLQHDRRTAKIKRESLNVRAFYDKNVLEVFVNDRVAMSTYVQPDSKKCFGINSWVGDKASAKMMKCELWELKLGGREQKL